MIISNSAPVTKLELEHWCITVVGVKDLWLKDKDKDNLNH